MKMLNVAKLSRIFERATFYKRRPIMPEVANPSIAIDVSISKTFPVDLQNYNFFKYRKKKKTFSEVSSEMFSYGLRKTNVRKDS